MTKARTLADFISDGSPLADGTISVSEVSGAAPLDNPTFTGTVTVPALTSTGNITLGDNDKAIFGGTTSELQIYSDGSQSIIHDAGTGNLRIRGSDITLQDSDGNGFISMVDGGAGGTVFLKHLGSNVLATTSTGVDITGDVGADTATIAGTVTATSVSLNALLPTNAFATLVLNNAVGIANDPVAIDTWLETTASDGYKYGDMDKNGIIGASDGSQIVQIAGGVASEAVTSRWYDIVVPSLVQQSWYGDLVADGTLVGGGAFSGPLTGNVTGELDLTAIAETISDTAVDVFVYDTSKDSDGGAWRKRTQGTSWYNETLNTATRGSRKEFPAVAVIVGTSTKLTIYDGDDPDLPMWAVLDANTTLTSVFARNGLVCPTSASAGVVCWNFVSETLLRYISTGKQSHIWTRDVTGSNFVTVDATAGIVSNVVNDVAMTVLPNAPIDAATGLPVPTIAVATDGGLSVIKDDGTVAEPAGQTSYKNVDIIGSRCWFSVSGTSSSPVRFVNLETFQDSDYVPFSYTWPSLSETPHAFSNYTRSHTTVLPDGVAIKDDQNLLLQVFSGPETGYTSGNLTRLLTSTYNTGWMNGDIKLATLSDTDDTDVTGSDLVSSMTFYQTDRLTSYAYTNGGTTVVMDDDEATDPGYVGFNLGGLTAGKVYTLSFVADIAYSSTYANRVDAATSVSSTQSGTTNEQSITFIASATTNRLFLYSNYSGGNLTYTLNRLALAEEDRSVNGNGLQVFGSITKTPVATGADLVGYSGWTANDFLEQPYNSDLNFGNDDFCTMGWVKTTDTYYTVFENRNNNSTMGWALFTTALGSGTRWRLFLENTNADSSETSVGLSDTWTHFAVLRRGATVEFWLNGDKFYTSTSVDWSTKSASKTEGSLKIGCRRDGQQNLSGSLALLRISATAPSPEQIKKIYEDEKVLFQENAQATLYGTSDAVTALAYDDTTELLHVGTSAGRSDFQGLRRVNNTTNAVGAAISASNGMIVEE